MLAANKTDSSVHILRAPRPEEIAPTKPKDNQAR
jgi:hypothetical protein